METGPWGCIFPGPLVHWAILGFHPNSLTGQWAGPTQGETPSPTESWGLKGHTLKLRVNQKSTNLPPQPREYPREVALVLRRMGKGSQRGHRHICRPNELTCVVDMFCILVVSVSIFWLWYCYYSSARYHLWKKLGKGYTGPLCIISYNYIYRISKKL